MSDVQNFKNISAQKKTLSLWAVWICDGKLSQVFGMASQTNALLSPGQTDSQVNANLRFVWPPTCVDLHRLATTCVDFGRAQIWTQVDASFFYRLATQRKSTQVDTNYMREMYGFLRLASRLANPFGHPSQVRAQVLVLQTCVDLRRDSLDRISNFACHGVCNFHCFDLGILIWVQKPSRISLVQNQCLIFNAFINSWHQRQPHLKNVLIPFCESHLSFQTTSDKNSTSSREKGSEKHGTRFRCWMKCFQVLEKPRDNLLLACARSWLSGGRDGEIGERGATWCYLTCLTRILPVIRRRKACTFVVELSRHFGG